MTRKSARKLLTKSKESLAVVDRRNGRGRGENCRNWALGYAREG